MHNEAQCAKRFSYQFSVFNFSFCEYKIVLYFMQLMQKSNSFPMKITLYCIRGGTEPARLGFGSARLAFLEARLGLGSLAFGSLGNNLARY